VLRISRPKRERVVIKSKRMKLPSHGEINIYKPLVRKPEVKRPLRRSMHRWEDKINMALKYVGRVWIGFILLRGGTSGRFLLTLINLQVP
jgi:hypothetical protein